MHSLAEFTGKGKMSSAGGLTSCSPALGVVGGAAAGTPVGSPRPSGVGTPEFIQDNSAKVPSPLSPARSEHEKKHAAGVRRHQLQLQADLTAADLEDDQRKVFNCHRHYPVKHEECGAVFWRSTGFRCRHPLCAHCLRDRADQLAAKWAPVLSEKLAAGHKLAKVMLSTRRYPGESLDDAYARADKGWQRLRGSKEWRQHVAGELVALEVAYSVGWGVHYHLIVELVQYWPQSELSRKWHECTGDSMVVWISAIGTGGVTLEDATAEQIKYPCKPADILGSPDRVVEYSEWAKGRQLFKASGSFHGALKARQEALAVAEGLTVEELEERDQAAARDERALLLDTCPYCGGHGGIVELYGEGVGRAEWELVPLNEVYWGLAPPGDSDASVE